MNQNLRAGLGFFAPAARRRCRSAGAPAVPPWIPAERDLPPARACPGSILELSAVQSPYARAGREAAALVSAILSPPFPAGAFPARRAGSTSVRRPHAPDFST